MKVAEISLPKVSIRLTQLYNETLSLVQNNDIVADVGADHGYLSAMLTSCNKFKKVIATDISAPSLEKTANLAKELNLEIDTRVGDGLQVAPEATIACICGMGGHEIIKILDNKPKTKRFVFQPIQNSTELRLYLLKNRYKIVKDYVLEDKGKFYYIICVNGKGLTKYGKLDKFFGKDNIKNTTADFYLYLKNQINKLNFLEKFDITQIEFKQRKQIKQKQKYYKLCKKLIKQEV